MLEVLRSGQLSLGPRVPAFERGFAARARASRTPARSRAARPACTSRCARSASREGDEVVTSPFSFVRQRQRDRLRARAARSSPTSTRSRSTSTPRPPRRPRSRTARRRCCPSTSSATRPTCPPSSAWACRSSRTPARRSARATRDGRAVGGARPPGRLRLLRQQAADDRRGRDGHHGDSADVKERIDSERNQGRAPDMGWLDHDRLGFNYRLSDIACALGLAQLERLDDMLADRAARRRLVPRGAGRRRGPRRCRARTPAATCAAGSSSSSRSRAASTATTSCARCASAACRASPTCRRST